MSVRLKDSLIDLDAGMAYHIDLRKKLLLELRELISSYATQHVLFEVTCAKYSIPCEKIKAVIDFLTELIEPTPEELEGL